MEVSISTLTWEIMGYFPYCRITQNPTRELGNGLKNLNTTKKKEFYWGLYIECNSRRYQPQKTRGLVPLRELWGSYGDPLAQRVQTSPAASFAELAAPMCEELAEAFTVLSDAEQRKSYDQDAAGRRSPGFGGKKDGGFCLLVLRNEGMRGSGGFLLVLRGRGVLAGAQERGGQGRGVLAGAQGEGGVLAGRGGFLLELRGRGGFWLVLRGMNSGIP